MTGQAGEMSATPERTETIIIGGGQSGLAVGYHLMRQGRPFVILDANERIGDSWRKRWDSLRVFTPARLDGLPGMPFPAPASSFPTKDEVAGYLAAYAARFDLPVRTGVRVDGLARFGDRFVVTSAERWFEADNVVQAPGAYHNPRIPVFAPELDPAMVQMHSSEYRNPSQLRAGGVLVVGAGNSGAEIALEASRGHQTFLSGRDTGHEPVRAGSGPDKLVTPLMWFVAMHVLTARTPVGRKVQRMFRSRGIPLARVRRKDLTAAGVELVPRTAGVLDGSPALEDGRVLEVANVIWCTGFAPDLTWINVSIFNEDGDPVHDRGVVESEPGLYIVGMYFLYALSSVLIGGSEGTPSMSPGRLRRASRQADPSCRCQRARDVLQRRIAPRPLSAYTVAHGVRDWMAEGLVGRAPKTVSIQREVLEPLIGIIGAVPLREPSAAIVEANDKVRRNVATLVDTPAGQKGRPSKSLTFGQAVALVQAARSYGLYAYAVLSLLVGVRTEEARACCSADGDSGRARRLRASRFPRPVTGSRSRGARFAVAEVD